MRDFIVGTWVSFYYHDKARSGTVEKVSNDGKTVTLKLDSDLDGNQYKSFRIEKMSQVGWAAVQA
jgi:hypothetical protein